MSSFVGFIPFNLIHSPKNQPYQASTVDCSIGQFPSPQMLYIERSAVLHLTYLLESHDLDSWSVAAIKTGNKLNLLAE